VSLSERETSNRPLRGSVRAHGRARAAIGWAWASPKWPKRRRHERGCDHAHEECQGQMVRQTNDVPPLSSLFASAPGLNQEYLAFILAKRHACSEETAPVSEHVPGFLCNRSTSRICTVRMLRAAGSTANSTRRHRTLHYCSRIHDGITSPRLSLLRCRSCRSLCIPRSLRMKLPGSTLQGF